MTTPIYRNRKTLLAAVSLLALCVAGCAVGMQSIEADMAMGHRVAAEVENGLVKRCTWGLPGLPTTGACTNTWGWHRNPGARS